MTLTDHERRWLARERRKRLWTIVAGALFVAVCAALAFGQADPTSIRANGPITIGVVQAGADAPGLVIHELTVRSECKCICDPGDHTRRLTRLLLAAEWRAYKWVDLREYADWLFEVQRRLEVR